MMILDQLTTWPDRVIGLLLMMSVLSVWGPHAKWTTLFAALTCMVAMVAQRMNGIGVIAVVTMVLVMWTYYHAQMKRGWKSLLGCLIFIGVPLFYLHAVPGFRNICLLDSVIFAPDCIPYSLYLNIDKVLIGCLLLAYGKHPLNHSLQAWKRSFRNLFIPFIFVILVLFVGSSLLNYVRLDIKLPSIIVPWMIINLLFVCVAEEAFFRAFVQKELLCIFEAIPGGSWIAWCIASAIFGYAYHQGGMAYAALVTLAGFGYGYVYQRNQKIESAIVLHFLINLIHFIGFSFPALASITAIK